jgi:hypothetical protein
MEVRPTTAPSTSFNPDGCFAYRLEEKGSVFQWALFLARSGVNHPHFKVRPSQIEIVSDMWGRLVWKKSHISLTNTAGRKMLSANRDDLVVGAVNYVYDGVKPGNGNELSGVVLQSFPL